MGMGHLKEGLKKSTSLESLSLDFHRCPTITDTTLIHVEEVLKANPSLQNISLNFDE